MITLGWFTRRWQSLVIGTVAVVGMFSTVAGEGVLAQIEPDDTLGAESSTVRSLDPNLPVDVIEQGAIRESNLFHSFLEFNVDAGRGVYFFSPANIENILTRVTGNNPSRIFGVLGTFGDSSPNLFLMNPNGILFGPNASLDIEGSFFATTADAIRLGDAGLFSATEPAKSNLLTVNPSAFLFNAIAAQPILNQSQAASVIDQPNSNGGSPGLQVRAGQTLGLVGGDVRLEGGNLTAAGGRIELGSVAGIGEVSLTQMGNRFVLGYDSIAEFGDISLSEGAFVDASGEGGGDVQIRSARLEMTQSSDIWADTLGEIPGGEVRVKTTESVTLSEGSLLFADVFGAGDGGDVTILTQDLRILDGAALSASTFGVGNAGNLRVEATDQIEVIGSPEGNASFIAARVNSGATGNAGNLTLNTGELFLSQGSQISVSTFGEGNGGELNVNASQIELNGDNPINGNPSGLFAAVEDGATGNGGNVTISTQDLRIKDGAELSASTLGEGNSGNLTVTAKDKIEVIGSPEGNSSNIAARVNRGATGNGGNLTLETGELFVSQGGQISVGTFGEGNGGELNVNASQIELNGDNPIDGTPSGLFAVVGDDATGDGGNVTISTEYLRILDGASLSATTFGEGNSGNLTVTATDKIEVIGTDPEGNSSGIRAQVDLGATGNAGNLTLETGELLVSQGSQISVGTFGEGNGGELKVNASQIELNGDNPIDGNPSALFADVGDGATGDGGDVSISTQNLRILDGAELSALTAGIGDAGDLTVTATDKIEVIGTDAEGNPSNINALVTARATGNGGNLTLNTPSLLVTDNGLLSVATFGNGTAGNLLINTQTLTVTNDATVSAATSSPSPDGIGGNLTINASDRVQLTNQGRIIAQSTGAAQAGDIQINTEHLSATNGTIATSTEQSAGGAITITASDIRLFEDSDITSRVASGAGGGGNITLTANTILAFDDSDILAYARDGRGGDISLNTVAFFGENFKPAPRGTDPVTLDINDRVDINADGLVPGTITIPDTSFIENSFILLSGDGIDTDELIAESCIARRHQPRRGSFFITGTGGIPFRPGDLYDTPYQTGTVRSIPPAADGEESSSSTRRPWKIGDPIIEPTGIYRLANGELLMGRLCGE
ncbi:MAG: filamentous hemagglutinin N-terminal domain-containing protein [Coleofasciculus sp. C1-SOL-03]|uniref:two-partner secretion domain-containing protein n=1 Tax=Coleofasciculus sp. C1-SOL-03 TaxID=3069522 RepID=UPI0032FFDEFD